VTSSDPHLRRRGFIHEHRRRHYEYGSAQQAERTYVLYENHRLDPSNAHCTVCGKPQQPSQLEPGTGRCPECMP
jgi:hypothetical protein